MNFKKQYRNGLCSMMVLFAHIDHKEGQYKIETGFVTSSKSPVVRVSYAFYADDVQN